MTGLINIQHAKNTKVNFNGNQAILRESPKLSPKS